MQLIRAADYAVRLMIHFASLPPQTRLTREALVKATRLPKSFIAKILQSLSRAGLITSRRGLDGGFVLAVDAREISLVDVIEAIEGPIALNVCLTTAESCEQQTRCSERQLWMQAQAAMLKVLNSQSLAQLANNG